MSLLIVRLRQLFIRNYFQFVQFLRHSVSLHGSLTLLTHCLLIYFQIYEGEMAKLKRENDLLKNQLQRSLKELKAYQLKYPSPQLIDNDNDDDEGLSPWVTMPESMSPLLEAYDSRKPLYSYV